jgi:hypothetical protein
LQAIIIILGREGGGIRSDILLHSRLEIFCSICFRKSSLAGFGRQQEAISKRCTKKKKIEREWLFTHLHIANGLLLSEGKFRVSLGPVIVIMRTHFLKVNKASKKFICACMVTVRKSFLTDSFVYRLTFFLPFFLPMHAQGPYSHEYKHTSCHAFPRFSLLIDQLTNLKLAKLGAINDNGCFAVSAHPKGQL